MRTVRTGSTCTQESRISIGGNSLAGEDLIGKLGKMHRGTNIVRARTWRFGHGPHRIVCGNTAVRSCPREAYAARMDFTICFGRIVMNSVGRRMCRPEVCLPW
jgi:hypothetical protein